MSHLAVNLIQERDPLEYKGYMEDDLMEIDLKSIFRAFSSLENWIMI